RPFNRDVGIVPSLDDTYKILTRRSGKVWRNYCSLLWFVTVGMLISPASAQGNDTIISTGAIAGIAVSAALVVSIVAIVVVIVVCIGKLRGEMMHGKSSLVIFLNCL
ncbi:hypothetical protein GBAR_LOCUS11803, partial [Geodia barretti]